MQTFISKTKAFTQNQKGLPDPGKVKTHQYPSRSAFTLLPPK